MKEVKDISNLKEAQQLLTEVLSAEPKSLKDIATASLIVSLFAAKDMEGIDKQLVDDGSLDMSKVVMVPAARLLLIMQALVVGDVSEAYYQLYKCADPDMCSHTPWKFWFETLEKPNAQPS